MALTEGAQEKLISEISSAAVEGVSFHDFTDEVIPRVERLLQASGSVLYRCHEDNLLTPVGGALSGAGAARYVDDHYAADPTHTVMKRLNPRLFNLARHPVSAEFQDHPSYWFLRRHGVGTFLHVRLTEAGHHRRGMVGMLIGRSHRQPDFDERCELAVARLLPALTGLARRIARMEERLLSSGALIPLSDLSLRPFLVMDLHGGLLWASDQAGEALGLARSQATPALVAHARRIGESYRQDPFAEVATTVTLSASDGQPLRVDCRVVSTATGSPVIVAEIEASQSALQLAEVSRRYGLTRSEVEILALLAEGLSDREIAARRFISPGTVHTHVARVREKLGVHSRVQAALIARGVRRGDRAS